MLKLVFCGFTLSKSNANPGTGVRDEYRHERRGLARICATILLSSPAPVQLLRHLWVVLPIQILEIVRGEDVDVPAAAHASIIDYTLRVPAIEQALQGLQSITRLK